MTNIVITRRKPIQNTGVFSPDISPILQRIYLSRGVLSDQELDHRLQRLLPFNKLTGINQAVQLLFQALASQQSILIVGDFDADGATSTAVAIRALKMLGFQKVDFLVPNRFKFGYGLTPELVEVAALQKPNLIITVDNGISSNEGVKVAQQKGIKVLVTDHHLPGAVLPEADALVNPNLKGDPFESKNLAGVGVIFYVMLALRAFLREQHWFIFRGQKEPNLAELLDLVALGTVADVVPLDQNNRIIVQHGIARIRSGRGNVGIKALLSVAGKKFERISTTDLGFIVGPRLNAAGRLEDMAIGIRSLLAEGLKEATPLAKELDALNRERRSIEATMEQEALQALTTLNLDAGNLPVGLCVYDPSWHQGVIGILAGRLKERFHRPTIAFAPASEHELKGSGRSILGLHIRDVLESIFTRHPGVIKKFGGHAMAAGLSLEPAQYELFKVLFDEVVRKHLTEDQLQGQILSDGELGESDFSLELAQHLKQSGPWGQGFPQPLFDGTFEVLEQRLVGEKHLKMRVAVGNRTLEAIAFNVDLNRWPNPNCQNVHLVYQLDVNEYKGETRLQLLVEHLEVI